MTRRDFLAKIATTVTIVAIANQIPTPPLRIKVRELGTRGPYFRYVTFPIEHETLIKVTQVATS